MSKHDYPCPIAHIVTSGSCQNINLFSLKMLLFHFIIILVITFIDIISVSGQILRLSVLPSVSASGETARNTQTARVKAIQLFHKISTMKSRYLFSFSFIIKLPCLYFCLYLFQQILRDLRCLHK